MIRVALADFEQVPGPVANDDKIKIRAFCALRCAALIVLATAAVLLCHDVRTLGREDVEPASASS